MILALDGAAYHDIVKGEPDLRAEWLFVILSLVLFAGMIIERSRGRGS